MEGFRSINGSYVCEKTTRASKTKGVFFKESPLDFLTPVFFLQISTSAILIALLQATLTPLGESAFVSQMLVGIALGPSFMGQSETFTKVLFPPKSFYISETYAFFGCTLFMFLVGVKMDLGILKRTGKKAVAIGLSAFFAPMTLNTTLALVLKQTIDLEPSIDNSLLYICLFLSCSSFHVVTCLLSDLKLLNSELGRLAVSSSMISGIASAIWLAVAFSIEQHSKKKNEHGPWGLLSLVFMVLFIVYILRPIMVMMIRRTPKGKPIREGYIVAIFIMLLGCSLFGEFTGHHFMIGPMILGLAVPDGPPLGSALVEKVESFVTSILLPLYFLYSGANLRISSIQSKSFLVVQMLAMCSFIAKLIGTLLPSFYCQMPLPDAFALGLIMSSQGITDILILQNGRILHMIDREGFSILAVSAILITGTITPLVKIIYDPSARYTSLNRRRTIEHSAPNDELRVLASIYEQDSTPLIINLLEISNPTTQNPIAFYVLHLVPLTGRSSSLFIAHQTGKRKPLHSNYSDHVVNAFRLYELHNESKVMISLFTSVVPYANMHDEICTMAMDKRTSMIILPFHKKMTPHGFLESRGPIRSVNLNVLRTAPCSVGILVERCTLGLSNPLTSVIFFSIGVIFVEGSDDREALSYAMRMTEHPNVRLTLIRMVDPGKKGKTWIHRDHDIDIINKFKVANMRMKRHVYKEHVLSDTLEMVNVIRSVEDECFDLVIVGRRHSSPLFMGLIEWNEYAELGFIGDMLVSSDSNTKVTLLVVQQQRLGSDFKRDKTLDHGMLDPWNDDLKKVPPEHKSRETSSSEFTIIPF